MLIKAFHWCHCIQCVSLSVGHFDGQRFTVSQLYLGFCCVWVSITQLLCMICDRPACQTESWLQYIMWKTSISVEILYIVQQYCWIDINIYFNCGASGAFNENVYKIKNRRMHNVSVEPQKNLFKRTFFMYSIFISLLHQPHTSDRCSTLVTSRPPTSWCSPLLGWLMWVRLSYICHNTSLQDGTDVHVRPIPSE